MEGAILPLATAPHIIDLGCGPGLWLRDVPWMRPDATLAGYDNEATMLDAGRSLNLPNAHWEQADIGSDTFTLPKDAADVVAPHFVLHMIPDPRHLLTTIREALHPRGVCVITGWVRTTLEHYMTQTLERACREGMGGEDPAGFAYRMFSEFNCYTLDDMHWLLEQHGFGVRREARYRESFAYLIAEVSAGT